VRPKARRVGVIAGVLGIARADRVVANGRVVHWDRRPRRPVSLHEKVERWRAASGREVTSDEHDIRVGRHVHRHNSIWVGRKGADSVADGQREVLAQGPRAAWIGDDRRAVKRGDRRPARLVARRAVADKSKCAANHKLSLKLSEDVDKAQGVGVDGKRKVEVVRNECAPSLRLRRPAREVLSVRYRAAACAHHT